MSLLKSAHGAELQQDVAACGLGAARTAARTAERVIRVAAAQRVRWGLTGLAAIFLLVLVVSAGLRPAASVAPVDSHSEPLAVLGVAPGSGPAVFDRDGEPRTKVAHASRI